MEIWRYIYFSRWRPTTSGFVFLDVTAFRRSKSISEPNFVQISPYWRLRYNYFHFWKTNVRHIGNLLSVSISTICPKSAHYSASGYRISSKSEHPLQKYDVIFIFQDGGRDHKIPVPVSYLLITNVRHIGNVLSVSISTICLKFAHYVASGYRILSKSKHPLRKYDVISISQDGGRDR